MRALATLLVVVAIAAVALAVQPRPSQSRLEIAGDFTHFESAHVHPLALTPDGTRLLAVNTPDARLAVFDVTGDSPVRVADIPVGLEPVSVAARSNGEAWVVNTLSDDISIVDLTTMHVKATLRVGDEPSDVVFAGSPLRAWVSVSQEDAIKVYDPADLAGAPAAIGVPARWPRALATNAAGTKVYCAIFASNHRSTAFSEAEAGDSLPAPNPPMRAGLPAAPKVGLIVNFNGQHWVDESGKWWDSKVKYQMQLNEVIEYDAATRAQTRVAGDLATVLMGVGVSPLDGTAAAVGTYSRTEIRFEPNLRGHLTETRLGLWPAAGNRQLVQVNAHINYAVTPGPQPERDSSLALPTCVTWSADGQRVYASALGSNKLGVFNTSGTLLARVPTVAGPTGVLADPARARLYVLGRFRNQLQTLSTADFSSLAVTGVGFDPTPDAIVNGRKFFYGGFTSGHGDEACASCHLFGDWDFLAWDLGNPLGDLSPVPPGQLDPLLTPAHPMKGPMVTQSLRGLPGTGLLHWRGDRANLAAFNAAFVSLMGRAAPLPDSEMTAFGDFVLPLVYPPNPNENLDRSLRDASSGQPSAVRGRAFYVNTAVDATLTCASCHALPTGTIGQLTDRLALQAAQDMKIPQLRNEYKKTGFRDTAGVVNKRGFGFTHNGSIDNLFDFLLFPGFNFGTPASVANANRRDVEAFVLAFDTGTAPAVGAQVTFDGGSGDAALVARMDTLVARADSGDCDLVAKGRIGSLPRSWKYSAGSWQGDRAGDPARSSAELRALASAGHELTVTGVPPGAGTRMGLDRDRDGWPDADELAAGSDPGDPASTPTLGVGGGVALATGLRGARPNPFRSGTEIDFTLGQEGAYSLAVYDVMGREVRSLAHERRVAAGVQRVAWDGRRDDGGLASAGVYFVRLRIGQASWSRMLVRIP
jgi:YVTN family beta-propeller protein